MYRLMIVDDEPLTREFIQYNLSSLDARWTCGGEAEDGQEALRLLEAGEQRGEPFDLVLTDIRMPVMDGLALAQRISEQGKKLGPCPRVVILSGYDEFPLAQEAMRHGVDEYMLKPIVREELVDVLDKMAERLAQDRAKRQTYQTLVSLSESSREQVARNFLRAVASDNHVETKALYPILFRLKISLLEAEGAILLVRLNDSELLQRADSYSDIALFRYILHQTATELAQQATGCIVFFDGDHGTAVLVAGENMEDVRQRTHQFYTAIADAIRNMTGLSVWGAAGSCEMDVLQLGLSYRAALNSLKQRLFTITPCLLTINSEDDDRMVGLITALDQAIAAIQAAIVGNREPGLTTALRAYVRLWNSNEAAILEKEQTKGCLYMIERLSAALQPSAQHALERAWTMLKEALASRESGVLVSDDVAIEETIALYRNILQSLYQRNTTDSDHNSLSTEHEIVTQAKQYIDANYPQPLSLALIAEKVGVTPGYLSSLFHRDAGESYIKYLTRIRMEQAAMLLRLQPAEKVYDVAERVGYVSVKHFSYVFKQHYGVPPGEYQTGQEPR